MSRGMDERKKAAGIAATGKVRAKALRDFKGQMKEWGLVMPSAEPLVSDFGLCDFLKTGLIECWVANEIEAGYCGKFLFVFDGQTCPLHLHKTKHETFFLVRGRLNVMFGGRKMTLRPGDCLPVPAGVQHSFTGKGPALLLEVSKPCIVSDNVFDDPEIPLGGNYKPRSRKV
jgi:mannose-6-phosphate isomerase-like protein (cupin superfamily)